MRSIIIQGLAAIERIAGRDSIYYRQAEFLPETNPGSLHRRETIRTQSVMAAVNSLRLSINNGFIESAKTLIRGEVFSDFLDMAKYLSESGYKDAAAVIAGSTLESHLRQLCLGRGMDTERQTNSGTRPISADTLNANLAKAEVYSINDQKSVTACLGLRNDAAHGHYERYTDQQVELMINSVRDFIARNPQ